MEAAENINNEALIQNNMIKWIMFTMYAKLQLN